MESFWTDIMIFISRVRYRVIRIYGPLFEMIFPSKNKPAIQEWIFKKDEGGVFLKSGGGGYMENTKMVSCLPLPTSPIETEGQQ